MSIAAETPSEKLAAHVQEDCDYYLVCSECEDVSGSWHNPTLAALRSYEQGWRINGTRPICPKCIAARKDKK